MTRPAATVEPCYRVLQVRDLTKATYVLRIERNGFQFRAGQCVSLGIKGTGINREYSTYSGENESELEFLIREVPNGIVSAGLRRCRPGDELSFMGAYGSFVLENARDQGRKYLFVASGTGIAPFHSFVRTYPALDYTLLHGVRHLDERYDLQHYEPSRYTACVSRDDGGDFKGHVTDYLRLHPVDPATLCYLCGNSAMLADAFDILREQGVPGNNLFTEAFF